MLGGGHSEGTWVVVELAGGASVGLEVELPSSTLHENPFPLTLKGPFLAAENSTLT